MNRLFTTLFCTAAIVAFVACSKEEPSAPSANSQDQTEGTAHTDAPPAAGHGGGIIELGTTTIGPFTVRASRDVGEIDPGGDAPIDVWLTGGDISNVTAVRFWIGTESGTESVKALAEIEIPSEPNHWHTHAEVPSPLPDDARLWVEIEAEGQKTIGSFELKE